MSSFEFPFLAGWGLSVPIVGLDPEEETRLLNLDAAITSGRYLRPDDHPREDEVKIRLATGEKKVALPSGETKVTLIPILVNGAPYLNAYTQVQLERYNLPESFDLMGVPSDHLVNFMQNVTSTLLLSDTISPQTAVLAFLGGASERQGRYRIEFGTFLIGGGFSIMIPSPVSYRTSSKPEIPASFVLEAIPQGKTDYGEVIFRKSSTLQPESLRRTIRWEQVGVYDPPRLGINPTGLIDVPLEVYYPPYALLKYAPDGTILSPQLIRPTLNAPINYLLPPPYALVTLDTAQWLTGREDYISAIRVRVTGTEQRNVKSQALVEAVAAEIERWTGLHVDITLGSSLNRTMVYIPGYEDIPPLGYVEEGWVVKGANRAIAHRVNWANLVLSLTAFVTCLSAIAILLASSTLARTRQWSLLHALGWRPGAIRAAVLLEAGLLGGVGGLLALGVGWLIGHWLKLSFTWGQFVSVPPVTFLLCLLASSYALRQVDALRPVTAMRQGTVTPSRWRVALSSMWALSLRGLMERRGLSTLSFLMLTATTTLLVMLLGIGGDLERFLGTTRLGDHLLGLAGWYYYLLLVVCLVIAGVAIADLVLTEVRRRRAEIGVLLAIGWRKAHIVWVFVGQAALLGMAGGLSGSFSGMALLKILGGERPLGWPQASAAGVVFILMVSIGSALYPAWQAAHVPPAESMRCE
ncbi:MAG: FtsX-like permease family protein [Chloroflexota bacterium]